MSVNDAANTNLSEIHVVVGRLYLESQLSLMQTQSHFSAIVEKFKIENQQVMDELQSTRAELERERNEKQALLLEKENQ